VSTIIDSPDSTLNVPALCDIEVCSGMRRGVRMGLIDIDRAVDSLVNYLALPLTRHGHTLLIERAFQLRDNFSAYDATYIALCERLGATLVTCDGQLTRGVQEHLALNVVGVTS
jgi:predicted nucleic acid-binding protein